MDVGEHELQPEAPLQAGNADQVGLNRQWRGLSGEFGSFPWKQPPPPENRSEHSTERPRPTLADILPLPPRGAVAGLMSDRLLVSNNLITRLTLIFASFLRV